MKKHILKTISVCGLVGGALLLSACGTPGKVKITESFRYLEGQSITNVISSYGIPDHKDTISGKDAFVYEYHKDYLVNSLIKGNHRVRQAGCTVTFMVNSENNTVTKGSVIGDDEECDVLFARHKKN